MADGIINKKRLIFITDAYAKLACGGVFWRFCDSHEQKNTPAAEFFVSPDLKYPGKLVVCQLTNKVFYHLIISGGLTSATQIS
jgi:hypothetical protein